MSRKKTGQTSGRNLRIAVLISGDGTGLQNLIDRIADGRLRHTEVAVVISSRTDAQGVQRARAAGLPVDFHRAKDFQKVDQFSDQLTQTLDAHAVDLAVQAGWLCYWKLPGRWLGKTINIHPALLPKFGGQGYYGLRVHKAVLAAGEIETGATTHWVDNQYDHGRIILQSRCEVRPDDTPDTLAARVHALEHELLPRTITLIREGKAPRQSSPAAEG